MIRYPIATALAFAVLGGVSVSAQVVDDFSDGTLTEYTLTRVLDNGIAESNISFDSSSGGLVASYGGTVNQAEQVVLLRSDFSLGVGQTLYVDVSSATDLDTMDFGIAVSGTATPTSADAGTTDRRGQFSWLAVYFRPSQNAVRVTFANNTTPNTNLSPLTGGVDETTVKELFIQRTSATDFSVGYVSTSDVSTVAATATFTATNVGTAIGFYADLRAVGGNLGTLDNLRIVPEPSTYATLLGIVALGFVAYRRRRRA